MSLAAACQPFYDLFFYCTGSAPVRQFSLGRPLHLRSVDFLFPGKFILKKLKTIKFTFILMNLFHKWPLNDCNKIISICQDWRRIFFFRNSNEWFWLDVRRGLWIKICISELPGRAAAGQVIKSVACERRTEDSLQLSFKMISHNKETHFKFTKLSARSVFMFLIFFSKNVSERVFIAQPANWEWMTRWKRGKK